MRFKGVLGPKNKKRQGHCAHEVNRDQQYTVLVELSQKHVYKEPDLFNQFD